MAPIAEVLVDLGIDRGTFDKWRTRGVGPRMKLLPNRTRLIRGDWYDACSPWTTVTEICNGVFVWDVPGSHSGEYTAEWLPDEEREARWAALGLTLDDF